VSHRLCGGLLLLQAKSDTVVDNDATDSFYNNLEPSCKKLSTFRIVKNSHHDLLCSKEEVFGELLEEINFFVLP
jgi:alpha-beta hydrolase superfamily lysophospholipase